MKKMLFSIFALLSFSAVCLADDTSIGIPECDDYLTKYVKCITEKVPAASQEALKQSLDMTRQQWKAAAADPASKDALAQGCKTAMETVKQTMTAYGCTF